MPQIDYYLSLNSPWTYLGAARFMDLVSQYGVDVAVKPAKFGDIFAKTGGLPLPKRAPERQAYRMMELKRWREDLGIPIVLEPKHFPSNEAPGVRAVIAVAETGGDALRLATEIGKALWERDENIAEPAIIEAIGRSCGVDVAAALAAAPPETELDAIWDANTEDAISKGVFGAPSYRFADGEIMWGQDRLHFVAKKLAAMSGV